MNMKEKLKNSECDECGLMTGKIYASAKGYVCADCFQKIEEVRDRLLEVRKYGYDEGYKEGRKDMAKELEKELLEMWNGLIKWKCQCPPERRGAEITLLHLLGMSWEEANKFSFNCVCEEDLITQIKKLRKKHLGEDKEESK